MTTNVRRRIAGLFGAAILLLGSLAGLRLVGYRNTTRLIESDRQIAHSQRVVDGLRAIYSAFQEAEGAQRGYLLTRDVQFLRAYHAAADAIPGRIASLAALLGPDPHQSDNLRQAIPLLTAELTQLDAAVRQGRGGAPANARAQVENTARGARSMAEIANAIRGMQDEELVLMNSHANDAAASSSRFLGWFLTLSAVDLVLLAAGFALLNRHMSRRERAEARAARLNDDLRRKNEELELAQRQMQAAKEAAEAANRAKDQFLATVTHELRSPLSAILLWADVARRSGAASTDPDVREALDAIETSAQSQSRLVEDLLDVSRIVHGKLRMQFESLNLPDVARASTEAHALAAREKGVALEAQIDNRDISVRGDPHRLRQVIGNLLSNALKFTPQGGRVRITAGRFGNDAFVRVEDNGRGISPEFLPRLFDRFTQADPTVARERTGLGLGLAIVQHIAQLHGGSVQAHSDGPGRGATFTLTLPCVAAPASSAPAPAEPAPEANEALQPAGHA